LHQPSRTPCRALTGKRIEFKKKLYRQLDELLPQPANFPD
jgi:hypothetical protein